MPSNSGTQPPQAEPSGHNDGTRNKPEVGSATQDESHTDSAHPNSDSKAKKPKRDWLDIANFVVLVGAFVAAVAAACEADRLANLTDKAIIKADQAAATQHADTLQALAKADDANKTASDTAGRQLRAYVYAKASTKMGLSNIADNQIPEAGVIIRNSGQTPARNVIALMTIARCPAILPPNTIFRVTGTVGSVSVSYLPPSVDNETGEKVRLDDKLTAADVVAVKNGTGHLCVFGTIRYVDVFLKPHYTDFCWSYHGPGPVIKDAEVCNQHNDGD